MKKLVLLLASVILGHGAFAANLSGPYTQAANAFGLKSMQYAFDKNPGENAVYSPISAHLALSMLLNGAQKKSADEISRTLGLSTQNLPAINQEIATLMTDLNSRPDGELKLVLANGMWVRSDLKVNQFYSANMQKIFQAEIAPLRSVADVNAWAAAKTNGLIKKVLDDASDIELLLANATYFKADWTTPFSPSHEGNFNALGSGTPMKAQMMSVTTTTKYMAADGTQAVELPYGKNKMASLIAILPPSGGDFTAFRRQADIAWLNGLFERLDQASLQRVGVTIPKVNAVTSFEMNQALSEMGMPDLFTNAADLSLISYQALKVSKIKQDALIKIDEKGTEAAAVTSIGVRTLSVEVPDVRFVADRPFLYFIRDNKTGVILFAGQIVKP